MPLYTGRTANETTVHYSNRVLQKFIELFYKSTGRHPSEPECSINELIREIKLLKGKLWICDRWILNIENSSRGPEVTNIWKIPRISWHGSIRILERVGAITTSQRNEFLANAIIRGERPSRTEMNSLKIYGGRCAIIYGEFILIIDDENYTLITILHLEPLWYIS